MIDKPTVLIVGAGGSMPYQFPSGMVLLRKICDFLDPDRMSVEMGALGGMVPPPQLHLFRNDLLHSGAPSVDEFLASRPELVECGKRAIACALIQFENPSAVIGRESKENWYEHLWGRLKTPKPEGLESNRLSILTFNYDRSLEFYLFHAIRSTYGLQPHEAQKFLRHIKIIHLHGHLGELEALPTINPVGRDFTSSISPASIQRAADKITIIHEADEGSATFDEARGYLEVAERICFLGFGYHPTNLRRLRIAKAPHRIIEGTSVGISPPEMNEAVRIIGSRFEHMTIPILDFLKQRGTLY
jgi:hypothetical protein